MKSTRLHYLWRDPSAADGFAHGGSLHSHTSHSRESLEFIPQYAKRSKFLAKVMELAEWQYRSRTGNVLDCSRAYWTPPLSPGMAVDLETAQIAQQLGLPAFVSLTDHDNCEAGLEVDGPVSIEWTVPCAPSFFHLGVHNLHKGSARAITAELNAYTAHPRPDRLCGLLEMLNLHKDALVVLNHPLWDEGLIGQAAHAALLDRFLRTNARWIHALELNGLRSAAENEQVSAVAAAFQLPVISGGDRHGREPNANVNLTCASSFAEFVHEVRCEKLSEVLFMPQYREPLRLRQFETAWDILRYDRRRTDGRHSWCHRVYFTTEEGVTWPLTFFFGETGPQILLPFLAFMRILEQPAVRPVLRAALGD